ncbi:MAG: hypothetical protein EBU84_19250, partial [Actinobacteria bacterium]|nr:hypothetical protein [Actinomycetota bacterium]
TVNLQAVVPVGMQLASWDVYVDFSDAALAWLSCTTSLGGDNSSCSLTGLGRHYVSGFTTSPVMSGTYSLATLTFSAIGPDGSTGVISPSLLDLSDGNSEGIPANSMVSGSVTIANTPIVVAVTPGSGWAAGGKAVTLSGSNFATGASIKFGTTSASQVVVGNSTSITAVTPPNGVFGDVNGNGTVTSLDAYCAFRVAANQPGNASCPEAKRTTLVDVSVTNLNGLTGKLSGGYLYRNADANGNGNVTSLDAYCVFRIAANQPANASCPRPGFVTSSSLAEENAAGFASKSVDDIALSLTASSSSVNAGGSFTVSLGATISGAASLVSWDIWIDYDSSIFTWETCTANALVASSNECAIDGSRHYITGYRTTAAGAGTYDLATIVLRATGSQGASGSVTPSVLDLSDGFSGVILSNTLSGTTVSIADTTAPTISSLTTTGSGTKKIGDTVPVTINFSEAVTSTGTSSLAL